MDGKTLHKIRDTLLQRRQKLDQSLGQARENGAMMELSSSQAEIIDLAQAMEQLDRDRSLAEQERRERDAIDRALARIAAGAYGVCEECDEDIPPKRLMVMPMARLCARCQEVEERIESRTVPRVIAR